jgi:hypothetical protein
MKRILFLSALLPCLFAVHAVHADPIHGIAGGAYWHHDSGWEFTRESAGFERVGIPQDVAGSRDAVAYYARLFDDSRIVASVDVYPADSSAAEDMVADNPGTPSSESPFAVGAARPLSGTRRVFAGKDAKDALTVLYLIPAGEWRVRIRVADASPSLLPMLDAFALEQRWDTLSGAPTPR